MSVVRQSVPSSLYLYLLRNGLGISLDFLIEQNEKKRRKNCQLSEHAIFGTNAFSRDIALAVCGLPLKFVHGFFDQKYTNVALATPFHFTVDLNSVKLDVNRHEMRKYVSHVLF